MSFGTKSSVPKTETIKVEAKVETTYYVTFRGEPDKDGGRGIVAVDTVTVDGPKGTEGTLDISGRSVIPESDTSAFEGWMTSEDGDVIADTTIAVTESTELYAKVVKANWIHFDENVDWDTSDSDPTYTGPVYVKKTDNLADKKPADPTRPGYKFGGWYTDTECTSEFVWSGTGLEEDITLYAKWEPDKSGYTVIIWKQKVTDDKNAADSAKTYDFDSSQGVEATTGTLLSEEDFVSYTRYSYAGFHYGRIEISPEDKKVRADGTTVVNVYYDRNLLTIYFYDGSTQPGYAPTTETGGQQYGLVDGEYVSLTRHERAGDYYWTYPGEKTGYSGDTYREASGNSGTQYAFSGGEMVELTYTDAGCGGTYWALPNGDRYDGTRYFAGTTGNSGYGIVNGELVNITHDDEGWSYTSETEYTGTRYITSTIPADDHIYTGLYGSTLESNGYKWKDDRAWYENRNGTGTRLTFLDAFKFEGLSGVSENGTLLTQYGRNLSGQNPIRFYKQNIDETWPTTATNTVYTTGGNTSFTVTEKYEGFKAVSYRNGNTGGWTGTSAGRSLDANNLNIRFERQKYTLTFIDPTDGKTLGTKEDIPYEDTMSKYKIADPSRAHYEFKGWCEDTAGTAAFDWTSTMPAANKVLYAKWEPKQYHVSLDANGGTISGTLDDEFNVPYETELSRTSLFQNVSYDNKHELVGWFYKSGPKAGSVYDFGKIEEDVSLIAKWRMPGQVTIVYEYGEGDDGSSKPVDEYKYATDSSVVLGEPPEKIKEKYAFVGWKLKDKDGKVLDDIYYPNNTFQITDDLIADYNESQKTGTVHIVAAYNKTDEGSFTPTKIIYDPNGGTGSAVTINTGAHGDLLVNEPVIALAVDDAQLGFTREGYKFTGWNTDKDGGGLAVAAGKKIAGDLRNLDKNTNINTLYAQWVQVFTVTFDPDGGLPDPEDQTVESGETATQPEDPTKDNSDFLGWFEVVDGTMSETEFDFTTAIKKDTDLKAKWQPRTVTVTFDANGHGTAPVAQTIDKGATAAKPEDPTAQGYAFGGWFTEKACTNKFDFATPVNEDKTLYAKWTPTYKVKFAYTESEVEGHGILKDAEGRTSQYFDYGAIPAGDPTPAVTAEPAAGYTFGGWKKASTDSIVPNPDNTVTKNETYYATWTPNENTQYTVKWYYQKLNSDEYESVNTETRHGTTGETASLTEADLTPADRGDGHTYSIDAAKTKISGTIAGDGTLELHVYFRPQYTITYQTGAHGKVEDPAGEWKTETSYGGRYYGDDTPATNYPVHADTGYKFIGWDPVPSSTVTGDATYIAKWDALDADYTVEFYYQTEGEYSDTPDSTDNRIGKTDETVQVTDTDKVPDQDKEGYALDESKSDAWTGQVKADGSLVLKVYFKQQFTVTFDANGHGTAPEAQTVDSGKKATEPEAPTADGYTFGGWFTEAECTNGYDFETPVNENITLYAKWTENEPEPEPATHKVTYKYTGDVPAGAPEVPAEAEYAEGADVNVAAAPTMEGYTFSGWNRTGTFKMPGEDVEITGSWTAAEPEPEPTPTPTPTPAANHTVTYRYTGTVPVGAPAAPASATYSTGTSVTVAAAPTLAGYTFSGWSRTGTFTMPDSDVEITGSWTAVEEEETPIPTPTPTPSTDDNDDDDDDDTPAVVDDDDDENDDDTPATVDDNDTPTATPGGGAPGAPVAAVVGPPAAAPAPATPIDDNEVPEAEPETIEDEPAPLAAPEGTWALLNLIAAALTTVGAAAALFRKKEEDDEDEDAPKKDEDKQDNRSRNMTIAKVLGAAAAVASIVTFILTEDMSLPMAMTDKWTLLMAVLFAGQIGTAIANKKASESAEEDEEE